MESTVERAIPSTCPHCAGLLAASYATHCLDRWCGWVRCGSCESVISTTISAHTHGGYACVH